jgi:hypothetical protein
MRMMSLAVLVPFAKNGILPPFWSVQASDGPNAAKYVVQGYDVALVKVILKLL